MIAADEWQSFVWVTLRVMLWSAIDEGLLKQHFRATPLLYIVSDCNTKPLRVRRDVREAVCGGQDTPLVYALPASQRRLSLVGLELLHLTGARGILVSYPPLITH